MRLIFLWIAAVIPSIASQICEIPDITRSNSDYINQYGNRVYGKCHTNLTIDIKCHYSRMSNYRGKYPDPSQFCPGDNTRLHFYSDRISVLRGPSLKADFRISELYLENLSITKIAPGAFNYQLSIQSIFLSKNNLSQIGDGVFNSLTHLEVLDLSENEISNISEDAFASVPLKKMNISCNNISIIPDSFAEVKILDISHNFIKSIPSETFTTTTLNISSNQIDKIDLSYFPNINILCIADNAIERIDFQSATLQELDLHNNNIARLAEDLKNLEVLNVGGNKISNLPNSAILGKSLRELILSDNNISNIPVEYFGKLYNLEVLDLSKNSLSEFTFGTFDALQSLNTLNISYNKFKTLPIYIFHSMKSLKNLYFSHNSLTDINVDDLLKHFPNLGMVDMRDNALTCHNLVEVSHNLQKHYVSLERGSFTAGNNVYGMKCSGDYNTINTKEKLKAPEIDEAYATLLNYFNKEFRNSNFVQYLENLKDGGNKTEESNLLPNITNILIDIKQLMNEITKTNNNGTNIKYEINQKLTDFSNITENILKSLKHIRNYTEVADMSRDKEFKELSSIGFDIKQGLSGIGFNIKQVLETLKEKRGKLELNQHINQHSDDLGEQIKSQVAELRSSAENATSKGYTSVLTFISVLLTIMVGLMLALVYLIMYKVRHVINPNPDVELARLVESKPDTVNS